MDDAMQKEDSMVERKKQFALETQKEVEEFDKQIKAYYQSFVETGPRSIANSLDQGLEAMHNSKAKLQEFNARKDQLVLEEKLFGLPISTFHELKLMEEELKSTSPYTGCTKNTKSACRIYKHALAKIRG
jgi:dynein heavy chain